MKRHRGVAVVRWLIGLVLVGGAAVVASVVLYNWIRPQVDVTRVVEGPVVQAFYATGTLSAEREYPIKANAAGMLTEVLVDKGDVVKKDQAVAVVSEDSAQYRFDQAKAQRNQAAKLAEEKTSPVLKEFDARQAATREILEIARREQQRIVFALEKNAASQSDLDKALDRVKTLVMEIETLKTQRATRKLELEKELEVAEAAMKIAQWNLDRQTIRSPIDNASVLERPLTVGTRVAVNDSIMQIADVRPANLVMRAAVDEEDITYVRSAQAVHMTLYSFPGKTFNGRVKRVYDKADPQRRTFEVDVEMIEKNPAFAAGMTAELAFVVDQKERATVVPSQAVQSGGIWVVRDGRLVKAETKIGLRSVERTEVLSGLGANDAVVISPVDKMKAGQFVRTRAVDPVEAANLNKPAAEENPFRGFN